MTYILSMDMRYPVLRDQEFMIDIRSGYNIIIPFFNYNPLVFSKLRLLRVLDRTAILKESSKSVNYFRRSQHLRTGDWSMPVLSVARR